MPEDKTRDKVEALLFASGKPLDPSFITEVIEASSKKKVKNALEKLKNDYEERQSPLMMIEQDGLWKLTVREEFLPIVRKIVSDTELPKSVLETLGVIAWKSPTLQSEVIKVRTNKAYEHIDQLEKLGFIQKKKEGRSYKISLTEKFFDYFDVQKGDIKKMFKDSKNIERELEEEQKRKNSNESTQKDHEKEDISEAIEAEKPHLGKLEVVDGISEDTPDSVEIVDEIDEKKRDTDVKEAEEITGELTEDEKAKEEFEEIEEEAINSEDE